MLWFVDNDCPNKTEVFFKQQELCYMREWSP